MAVAVMMVLFVKGPEYIHHPHIKMPHLECAHITRHRMLADLTEGIKSSYKLWKDLCSTGHTFNLEPTDNVIEILVDLHGQLGLAHIERLLATENILCSSCSSKQKPPSFSEDNNTDLESSH